MDTTPTDFERMPEMNDHPPFRTNLRIKNPLCLSLDLPEKDNALGLLRKIGREAGMVKSGPVPFLSYGEELLREAENLGIPIFLDLKWHDIPNTVYATILALPSPAVRMVTVHALGGPSMVKAARQACEKIGKERPLLVAVTALTHLTEEELEAVGLPDRNQTVRRLGSMALESGADGLVLSPQELSMARTVWGPDPFLVTPGIRPMDVHVDADDQTHTATPETALSLGSDLLVVGRPILRAPDPLLALRKILGTIGR